MITPSRSAGFARIAFAGALMGGVHASAQAAKSTGELEAVFWRCDYETTQGLLDISGAAVCSSATEALRMARFEGDFNAMLAWWQQNKALEHRALRAAAGPEPAVTMEDQIRRMSDTDLKRLHLRCAQASEQRRLGQEEIAACSVGQETLLTRVFGGRFEALLVWSAEQLPSAIEVAQNPDSGARVAVRKQPVADSGLGQ
ncbi:MAG TPA: hypothetical protein VJ501_14945 [Burkholderiaceae bacterium]|nr:hypothetical protein [Burkholderiaceae bacterium]